MPVLSIENLPLIMIFLVPGFIAIKIYELLVPTRPRDYANQILEIITYSMVNLGVMSWAILLLHSKHFAENHPIWYLIGLFGVVVLSSAMLAIAVFKIRVSRFANRWMQHPIPRSWDYFFMQKRRCWVLFHLRNGTKIGGFYGENSYASSYPDEQDVYVEEVWRVDNTGRFIERVDRSTGMVIQYKDCELMEFFTVGE
jgi:Family of unknown function (DUF6338)